MESLDIKRIKEYNDRLKVAKERSATLRAQLNLNRDELIKLCAELTDELKLEVTPMNIEDIYNDYVKKINSDLKSGEDILARIEQEARMNEQGERTNIDMQTSMNTTNTAVSSNVNIYKAPETVIDKSVAPQAPVQQTQQAPVQVNETQQIKQEATPVSTPVQSSANIDSDDDIVKKLIKAAQEKDDEEADFDFLTMSSRKRSSASVSNVGAIPPMFKI